MSLTADRVGRITASRIPGILGLSPYSDRASVLREMVREHFGAEREFTGSVATEHGTEHEQDALAEYEIERGVLCEQVDTVVHPTIDYLAASPDGLVNDDGLIECKAPYKGTYTHIDQRPDYRAQIMLQLEVTDRAWCDFVVWRDDQIYVSRVERDPEWLSSVTSDLLDFMDDYVAAIADETLAAVHLEPLKDQRSDDEWNAAAAVWLEAKYAKDLADDRLAKAKQDLVNLAPHKPAAGAGVQVIHKKGSKKTAWAQFAKEHGLDQPGADYISYGAPSSEVRRSAS